MRDHRWTKLTPAQRRHCRRCTPSPRQTLAAQPDTRLLERTTHHWFDRSCGIADKRKWVNHYGHGKTGDADADFRYHYEEKCDWGADAPPSKWWSGPVPRRDLSQPVVDALPPLPPDYDPDSEDLAWYQFELQRAAINQEFERYYAEREARRAAWQEAERRQALRPNDDEEPTP